MPSVTARFSGADYYGGMTASLFTGESLGYLLVGLLAFALGVCVTVLCVRLHERERDEGSEEERGCAGSTERRLLSRRWSTRCGPPRASG